ncbi:MAG: DUF402 domain-containing protein [Chloroflexi bacterium]|nr:DUF402 domain-containing protein [Chloroflexota bacterium]
MSQITIIKQDHAGIETWRYNGRALQRNKTKLVLEANFNHPDLHFHGILLGKGDHFVETFYNDRWYNIFEIHDREDDHLKGWYCNVTYPAVFEADRISWRNLALDLLVYPDGQQLVLDEEEFDILPISEDVRAKALESLKEVQKLFA